MLARTPVLAANSGGPVETIRDDETGWLRSPDDVSAWSDVIQRALAMSDAELARMGDSGATRVRSLFGRDHMAARFDTIINDIVRQKRSLSIFNTIVNAAALVTFFTLGLVISSVYSRGATSVSK